LSFADCQSFLQSSVKIGAAHGAHCGRRRESTLLRALSSSLGLLGKPRDADSVKSNIARPRRSRANAVFVDFVTAVQSSRQQ